MISRCELIRTVALTKMCCKLQTSHFRNMLEQQPEKLTGSELLAKLKTLNDATKTERCDATGYYSIREDGSRRYNFTALYQAIAEANGVQLQPKKRGKRKLGWKASVLTTGAVLIGTRYCQELGLSPGDSVMLVKSRGRLVVEPIKA